jgi:hypothetical protein
MSKTEKGELINPRKTGGGMPGERVPAYFVK